MCKKWIQACGRKIGEIKEKNARVCSAHFDELCYRKVSFVDELAGTPRNSRPLNRDAVPYTFPGNCVPDATDLMPKARVTCEDPVTLLDIAASDQISDEFSQMSFAVEPVASTSAATSSNVTVMPKYKGYSCSNLLKY